MATSREPSSRTCDALRVIAVDDRGHFRALLRKLIDATPGFEVVDEAGSGGQAVAAVRQHHPDLVLMDIDMPGDDGIEATRSIKRELPSTVVVLVSATHPDDLPSMQNVRIADAIVWKPNLRPALIEEIWRNRSEAPASA